MEGIKCPHFDYLVNPSKKKTGTELKTNCRQVVEISENYREPIFCRKKLKRSGLFTYESKKNKRTYSMCHTGKNK